MGKSLIFDFMWKDEVWSQVEYSRGKINVIVYSSHVLANPFEGIKYLNKEALESFLESRCFSKANGACKLLLSQLGLEFYNVHDIIEITHGVCVEDFNWIRFKGEENLKWENVMTTYHKEHEDK